jgi:NAD(P)-dependent dehydrogenase (short-subunit alcohol dehydrogenase family)
VPDVLGKLCDTVAVKSVKTPSAEARRIKFEGKVMPTTNLFDLNGRVAAVTGGNGGIGRGIALGLAQAGAAIAVLARNEEKNQRVMSELQPLGVAALAVKVDVSVRGELQPALEKVEEKLGPISILVNNAGIVVVGNPDECAGTAVFLASRASDFVTGSTICVDGGYSIR